MKRALVGIAILATLLLSGCVAASTEGKTGDGQLTSRYVETIDGGKVLCVFWVPVDSTGFAVSEGAQMSCDWNARYADPLPALEDE